mgnify:CR=1 FL=1
MKVSDKWKRGGFAVFFLFLAYLSGNTAAAVQTAIQQPQTQNCEDIKQIAITFDDGPNPEYTPKLLDGLEKRGVKATFFLLGEEVEQYPDVVRRIHDDGHLIGVHSYKHVNFKEVGTDCVQQQIEKTQKAIYDVTGEYAGYIRPPYGCWQKELDQKVNLIEVLWNVDPRDWATTDADTVVQRILKDTKPGDIILLHDASKSSVQAAFTVIDTLQKQGYSFVTVEELLLE